MADLNDLAPLSKRLNAATDELNQALEAIQSRLNDLALGVEAWLDQDPREALATEIRDTTAEPRTVDAVELGYGRFGDGWALLVRTFAYEQELDEDGRWGYTGNGNEEDRKPLLRGARHLRVKAIDLIPTLIDALKAEASKVIDAVEKAKKIAESLK